jgi:hypothetical protein
MLASRSLWPKKTSCHRERIFVSCSNTLMKQISPQSLAMLGMIAVLTVLPAVIQGRLTNRWGPAADLESAAERLPLCPDQIGDWEMVSDTKELSDGVIRELGIAGYLQRTYSRPGSGQHIQLLMMVGSPGAISRHPPEICYAMRANKRIGKPKQFTIVDNQQSSHDFRLLQFQPADQAGARFLVCYGFTVDGVWTAPKYPRIHFGGQPLLYKMQLLCDVDESQDDQLPPVVAEFLNEFLPAFREACIEKGST